MQQCADTADVRLGVAGYLVHRLGGTGLRRQVDDVLHLRQDSCPVGGAAHISTKNLYARPAQQFVSGELWNSTAFTGATLALPELVGATDQRAAALDFFRSRRSALARS